MSYEVYVGNYPTEFSREDVSNLFKDFPGVTVRKFFKRDIKSYSFLVTDDIKHVVSVVEQMNNVMVSGRKLIVRASDNKLQEYIMLLINAKNNDCDVMPNAQTSLVPDCADRPLVGSSQKPPDQADNSVLQEAKKSEICKENKYSESYNREILRDTCEPASFIPSQVLRSRKADQLEFKKTLPETHSYRNSILSEGSNFEDRSYNIESSGYAESEASFKSHSSNPILLDDEEFSECIWLSVTNFPIGTTIRSIYRLFDDYEPLKVLMICNYPEPNRTLTEAYVCFLNRDTADDVILNFDNTIFRGRLLLVNDIEDLTVMNELMDVLRI